MLLIVPIKPSSHEAIGQLLATRSPFDHGEIPELDRYEVFLTRAEVVFLLEPGVGADALVALFAAVPWREHLDGPPRIAEEVYSWAPTEVAGDVYYLPTPGPGDSDGGDIF
jgi:hypothetical protein